MIRLIENKNEDRVIHIHEKLYRRYQDSDGNKLIGRTSLATEVLCMSSTLQLPNKAVLWHFRLGHPAHKIVNKVMSACSLPPEHWTSVCEPCQMAKSHRLPFTLFESRVSQPFALIHSDLWVLPLLLVLMVQDTLYSLWMTIQDFLGCI